MTLPNIKVQIGATIGELSFHDKLPLSQMSTRGPSIAPRTNLAPSPGGTGATSSPESASPSGGISIMTSREWVLPPRPKPGRKPSVDTPASKRKAQNRAAQRAFRERRATRVQELEEKLLEVEKEKEAKELGLVSTINKLKFENQFLIKSIDKLRHDLNSLQSAYSGSSPHPGPGRAKPESDSSLQQKPTPLLASSQNAGQSLSNPDKSELSQSAHHLLNFAKSLPVTHSTVSPALLQYSVQQILPAPSADLPPTFSSRNSCAQPRLSLSSASVKRAANNAVDFDCGVCLKELCLCEDVGLKSSNSLEEKYKSFTPIAAVSLGKKRKRVETEVDFTTGFTTKKMPSLDRLTRKSLVPTPENDISFNENSPLENCGFCSDDTPCVCREAAKEAARLQSLSRKQQDEELAEEQEHEAGPTLLPPIQITSPGLMRKASLPVLHPGPTLEIREFANLAQNSVSSVRTEGTEENASSTQKTSEEKDKAGCTGNPGTCFQCQTDPMSTLFCSTVASKAALQDRKEAEKTTAAEQKRPSFSMSRLPSSNELSTISSLLPGTPLPSTPCGSASNGIFIPCADAYRTLSRHKKFNTVDFSSLVGRLTTRGMLVEAQSVATLIRELDKKVFD